MRASLRSIVAIALVATGLTTVTPAASAPAAALDDTPWTLPSAPPRCTTAQANSGDVAGCLLAFYHDPADIGWGAPPAPGVGEGWNWQGYTYNGSPALAGWESTYIRANATPVAGFGPGWLQTHAAAQPLFEGFLDEIAANGYRVHGASGYSFRCTSGTGGWSCSTGDPDDLSNHAWGLAIDMNAGTNPIRSYSGIDGQTACMTPIQTDLPRWVIETAEKWGLYWGGYGWNSGCPSTTTQRTVVSRDPPHFEFRGTPAQAQAIAEFNMRHDPRRRCFDTIANDGSDVERCNVTGVPEAGWRLPVTVDAPAEAVAAMINLTAVQPVSAGHLALDGCDPIVATPSTSAVNFAAGETAAATAIVPLGDDDRFCVWRSTTAHSLVDVVGYLTESGERYWFDPSEPTRLTDTRIEGTCVGANCRPGAVGDLGAHTVPTGDDAPRIVNLTVVAPRGAGHAQAARCDDVATSDFSTINYVGGATRANLTLLDNGGAGSCVWVYRQTHVVVDELGRLTTDEGLGWQVDAPRRVLDTRECSDRYCAGLPAGGRAFSVDLGIDSPGAALTVTIAGATAPGHAWVGGCDELVDGLPPTSNVNYVPGKTTANLAIVSPDAGTICVYLHAAAHVVLDLQARLVDDHAVGLRPVSPFRVMDTRLT